GLKQPRLSKDSQDSVDSCALPIRRVRRRRWRPSSFRKRVSPCGPKFSSCGADPPVDITIPGRGLRLKQHPPLDEAGMRLEAEPLLRELVALYRSLDMRRSETSSPILARQDLPGDLPRSLISWQIPALKFT